MAPWYYYEGIIMIFWTTQLLSMDDRIDYKSQQRNHSVESTFKLGWIFTDTIQGCLTLQVSVKTY